MSEYVQSDLLYMHVIYKENYSNGSGIALIMQQISKAKSVKLEYVMLSDKT